MEHEQKIEGLIEPPTIPYINPVKNFALYAAGKSGNTMLRDWFMTNLGAYSFHKVLFRLPDPHRRRFLAGMRKRKKLAKRVWIKGSRANADLRHFSDVYRATVSHAIMETPDFQDTFKIGVVRNPASRVISAYLDKFCGEDWKKEWVTEVAERAGEANGISFNQFLDFLLQAEPKTLNRHWCPQDVLFEGVQFDRVVKLEHLSEGFEQITSIVGTEGLDVLKQRRQVQKYHAGWDDMCENITNTPSHIIIQNREKRNGAAPSKEKFLTEETRAKISQIYSCDFERFDYSPT